MSKEFDNWWASTGFGSSESGVVLHNIAEEAWDAALVSLEQKLKPPKPKTVLTKRSKEVLEYLRSQTGKPFRTRNLIEHRLNEGFTIEELKMVIDYAINNWSGTKYEKHIVPKTLFRSKAQTSNYLDLSLGDIPIELPKQQALTRPPQKPRFDND
jgi:uncharacterized phage protein (TIGR02220 family)